MPVRKTPSIIFMLSGKMWTSLIPALRAFMHCSLLRLTLALKLNSIQTFFFFFFPLIVSFVKFNSITQFPFSRTVQVCWLHYLSQALLGWHSCPWGVFLDYSSSACAAALWGLKSARTNAGRCASSWYTPENPEATKTFGRNGDIVNKASH